MFFQKYFLKKYFQKHFFSKKCPTNFFGKSGWGQLWFWGSGQKKSCPEKSCREKIFSENIFEKYFPKKPFSSKMIFLSPGTVKISTASKNWCLRNNFKIHISHGDQNRKHYIKTTYFLVCAALRKIYVLASFGQLFLVFSMSGTTFSLLFNNFCMTSDIYFISRATFPSLVNTFLEHFLLTFSSPF